MTCIATTESGSALRLSFDGRMTFNDHVLMKAITQNVADKVPKRVVADMSRLQFIDSAGVGMILILAKQVFTVGGVFSIERQQGQVDRVLSAVNVLDLFNPQSAVFRDFVSS